MSLFLNEKCGVMGVYGHPEAANLVYLGLYALQHRGQESAGIAASCDNEIHIERHMGLVADIFTQERLARLEGQVAIGHNRYSTTGESLLKNAQPFLVNCRLGEIAIAHNGNLINAYKLRSELEASGSIFQSSMDSEVVVHLAARSRAPDFRSALIDALSKIRGAYSMLILRDEELIGIRDPWGFRPLVMGRMGSTTVLASETCALDLVEAEFIREVDPGEVVVVNKDGITSFKPFKPDKISHCIFEFIYFARPDSHIFGRDVYSVRKSFGRQLAKENHVEADVVIAVPDSGIVAAMGYAQEAGIPFEMGLVRNHYVGRTFIEPQQSIRHFGVKVKLNPVREIIKGKRVVVIDDSIVRGTTSRKIVKMVRQAGAQEVHFRVSSPPITHPCFYGIDTPTRRELIASTHSIKEICKYLTADSVGYLSLEGMIKAAGFSPQDHPFCTACFSGKYPVHFPKDDEVSLGLY
jgi:amidophosphoribosyltransferase